MIHAQLKPQEVSLSTSLEFEAPFTEGTMCVQAAVCRVSDAAGAAELQIFTRLAF